jgi:tetratricopeptide (TPR) repeat protein
VWAPRATREQRTFGRLDRVESDAPVALALSSAFNYGGLHFEEHHAPLTRDAKELADAFAFFNANSAREAARADFKGVSQRVRDARHPAGGLHLVKVGSYMAARLKEKGGAGGFHKYYAGGAIPFFADYVRLYKSDASIPKALRFTPEFERQLARWDADWARTWNDYTRALTLGPETDFDAVGARLRKEFAGAEVYPDFTADIQPIQRGGVAVFKAQKLGVDLYPRSDELLFNWGHFILLGELTPEGRAALKQVVGEYERPLAYFRRAYESNPDGVIRPQTFLRTGGGWLKNPSMTDAGLEYVGAAVALYPRDAALREMLGDFLARKGRLQEAAESYRAAYNIDPTIAKGLTADDYVAQRLKAAAEQKKN